MYRTRQWQLSLAAVCVCFAFVTQANAQDPIFSADFSVDNGGFTVTNGIDAGIPAGPWGYSNGTWSADGGEGVVNSAIDSPVFTVPNDGFLALAFGHRYNFEDDGTTRWDAGQVRFSLNGGEYLPVISDVFVLNGYATDRVIAGNSPPLFGQFAFNNTSEGFGTGTHITSVANLGNFSTGDELSIRFIGAWDEGFIQTPAPNWEIGNVSVTPSADDLGFPWPEDARRDHQLVYQVFSDIEGLNVDDLRNHPDFPSDPSIIEIVNTSEIPIDVADNYGATLSGFFTPDESGLFDFYMASDDGGELWLSTDADPANKVLIAREPLWNGSRQYTTTDRRDAANPENRSTTLFPEGIPLQAGESYFVEGLVKEAGGGDHLSFTAQIRTDPNTPAAIPAGPLGEGSPLCNCGAPDIGLLSLNPNPTVIGDFNSDGMLGVEDIDLLAEAINSNENEARFDVTSDGLVDDADRQHWVEDLKGTALGDSNLDGKVDALDLNELGVNWLITDATSWAQADFNGDGNVNASDLNDVGVSWQFGVGAAAVPEPSALLLMFVGFPGLMALRRRRRPVSGFSDRSE